MSAQPVPIRSAPITLGQFLKLTSVAEDGAHAKELLAADAVTVNGEPEDRRGRQLADGDEVTLEDETFRVEVDTGA